MELITTLPCTKIWVSQRQDGDFKGVEGIRSALQPNPAPRQFLHLQLQHQTQVVVATNQLSAVGDAAVTTNSNLGLSLVVGDCFPIVVVDPQAKVLALIHGGWRSLVGEILAKTITTMVEQGAKPHQLRVWIGPGVRACCYESDQPPTQLTEEKWSASFRKIRQSEHTKSSSKNGWKIDLPNFITSELMRLGVLPKQLIDTKICTCCDDQHYFSHTRHKRTGDSDGRFLVACALA